MTGSLRGSNLKELLIACATAVEEKDGSNTAGAMLQELRKSVSVSGEPLQRLGAYMVEGLAARLASSGCRKTKRKETSTDQITYYKETLYEVCPYFKGGYGAANSAIIEAFKGEDKLHIIDFHISTGRQWFTLMRRLALRDGGPPVLRITGIDDSVVPAYARGSKLEQTGRWLSMVAREFGLPFEFHAVAISGDEVEGGHLAVLPGEAFAVNFNMALHRIPDNMASTVSHRDRILMLVKSLSPKVVTLVEQELDTSTGHFPQRFAEMLDYYTTVFESMDLKLPPTDHGTLEYYGYTGIFESLDPRDDNGWIGMEQHWLSTKIVNLVAGKGAERVERHEVFAKWKARLVMAGFAPSPLSPYVNDAIREKLQGYSPYYLCDERDGALYLGWKDKPLLVTSAWH